MTEKLYIYRIIVSVLVILTGLSGTIATFGISAFITYNNNYSGNLWSDMSYTGMTFFFCAFNYNLFTRMGTFVGLCKAERAKWKGE